MMYNDRLENNEPISIQYIVLFDLIEQYDYQIINDYDMRYMSIDYIVFSIYNPADLISNDITCISMISFDVR